VSESLPSFVAQRSNDIRLIRNLEGTKAQKAQHPGQYDFSMELFAFHLSMEESPQEVHPQMTRWSTYVKYGFRASLILGREESVGIPPQYRTSQKPPHFEPSAALLVLRKVRVV